MSLRIATILLSLLCIIACILFIRPWIPDDSFISIRYAENLANGNGPVYNVGERVEGYTSFLWVTLLAAGIKAGVDPVVLSRILAILFTLGCISVLLFAHRFIRNIDARISAFAVLLVSSSGIFLTWGVSGMEISMFTFLMLFSTLYYIKIKDSGDKAKFAILGALCAIAILARPEGMLFSGMLIAYHFIVKRDLRSTIYMAVVILLICLPYVGWRYFYYGYLLPNTFYAKVGFGPDQVIRGMKYALYFAIPSLMILFPLIDPPVIYQWFKRYRTLAILPLICGAFVIYVILVGGDSLPAFRFFVCIMPLICLLSAILLGLIGRKAAAVLVAAAFAYNLFMWNFVYILPYVKRSHVAEYGSEVGLWLKANVPDSAVIATNTAGSIPYYSGLKTIDMLGLNDLHIAHRKIAELGSGWPGHEKGDGDYILSRDPELIQFGSSLGEAKPVFRGDHELYENLEFHKRYVLRTVKLPSGRILRLYENRINPVLPQRSRENNSTVTE